MSIEERYPTHADYVQRVEQGADGLVEEGLLLLDDAEAIKQAAAVSRVRE